MADSASGMVPWETPVELQKHIGAERAQAQAQRKRLKEMLAQTQGLNEEEVEILEQQERRQKVVNEVNEDAMLDIMGQAAAGEKASKQEKVLTPAEVFKKRTSGIDRQLRKQLSNSQELSADIEALLGGQRPAATVSTESIDEQLASQLAQAQQLEADIEGASPLKPLAEELTPAAKKRQELEALFSGKKP